MSNPNREPLDSRREHRTKFVYDRRTGRPTPFHATPPQTAPSSSSSDSQPAESFNSEEPNNSAGEYTDSATEYVDRYFPIPTRRMFNNFNILRQRRFENSRRVDFDSLRALGVEQQFIYLTERVGFTRTFWDIEHNSYKKLTHEFLSSLQLKHNKDDKPYIKFQLGGRNHNLWVSQLRNWFGFHPEPETSLLEFREEMDKDQFWNLISGMPRGSVENREYKSLNIPHPVLRCTMRAIAVTIFARGETVSRANVEDLALLDHMLRPDSELVRPDLMLIMIHHWLALQRSNRTGGNITIGAYVTLIADRIGVPTTGDVLCRGPTSLNTEAFRQARMIKLIKGAAGHSNKYFWIMPDGSANFRLPISAPLSLEDRSTWLFTRPAPTRASTPSSPEEDEAMPDVTTPTPQVHASTSAAQTSQHTDPSISDLYQLVSSMQAMQVDMRTTQLAMRTTQIHHDDILYDIQYQLSEHSERVAAIEDELRDWRFYEEHGFYPGPSSPQH